MIRFVLILIFACFFQCAEAQYQPNYDESKVPEFKLPEVLRSFRGKKISSVKKWEKKRRPELLNYFANNIYGVVPGDLDISSFDVVEESNNALGGKATRKQVELSFRKNGKRLSFTILVYLPKAVEDAPLFLGYNFYGNHTIINDPDVLLTQAWVNDNPSFGIVHNQVTEQSRGIRAHRWPVEKIMETGYGLAVIYYGEIDPDKNDMFDGVHDLFYSKPNEITADNEWGAIAAWSWGLSRALDYFEMDEHINHEKVIVFGHSRLGKSALWAGANDQRFAGVISNNSGCGGAALSKRRFGETLWRINKSFPHWFCRNFKHFSKNEESLVVDQHALLALIAPRPLYVASAEKDKWADPRGEYLSTYYATPVWRLYGEKGMKKKTSPAINEPVINTVAYHIRSGKHDITDYDWEQYLKWADLFVRE